MCLSQAPGSGRARLPLRLLLVCGQVIFQGCFMLSASSCAARKPAMEDGHAAVTQTQANVMRFRVWECRDEEGIGGEVFRMLIPAEWKAERKIAWRLDVPMAPAAISFRVCSPDGSEAFEGFPSQPLFWTDNPSLLQMFPVGQRYFGAEVHRPLGIEDALQKIVLARFRKEASNVRVVARQALPEVVKALGLEAQSPGGGVRFSATAGKIRVEYELGGKAYTEDLFGVRESLRIPVAGAFGSFTNENWTLSYLAGARAPRGKLDAQTKVFAAMASSIRINKEWFNRYVQLVELLIQGQMQRIRMAGEFSRLLAQTSAEISDERMRLYESRQQAYDRISESFSDYMLNVDRYRAPDGSIVALPSGYAQAWINGLGECILSDRADYNPNVGSNQNWQPLEKK
ncbi:MAG: hypothetical protein GX446_14315 [Chthonomonadales bacterium]|nr:hypothetical protein [Chthonomonadales bacterium]